MNRYTVEWKDEPLDDMATFWMQHPQQRADMNRAEMLIDQLLAADPWKHARHLAEDLYKIAVPPLWAYCEIDQAKSEVKVTALAWVG